MKDIDIKKLLVLNVPYLMIGFIADKACWLYRHINNTEPAIKLVNTIMNFGIAFKNPLPSIHPVDVLAGIVAGFILKGVVVYRSKNAKKFRHGEEYGSARWGNKEDIKPFMDENPENNIIFTQTEGLTMSSRPKQPKYARNKNCCNR